ncbi:sporulation factor SpoIIGA [Desulfosporosinus acidiphilus SJ4]|uniref:Sporulation sigma-E factor-processing peptidase n=1 Tax=Desulfosporosinus acidiphilus (strain DSM 22704 / JCM 16185 / SJ4) TaxID=646529 RepID=I4DA06_DESAJ|nr:sigma-E processing peptidase SpoIIGA [Desulfosporosinus acidiphilus]AFM42630.1 sporulation factor SpoIIGA [Desulfosporosinus acidiphilus SJ4]
MSGAVTYLDLDMLVNGAVDALLLILIGRLIHLPIRAKRLFFGALIGEIPVILVCYSGPPWTTLSKFFIPFFMILAAYPTRSLKAFLKVFVGFWLLSAGLGGFVYAIWGWMQFDKGFGYSLLTLAKGTFWILPLCGFIWWILQHLWQRWQVGRARLEQTIFDLQIDFDGQGKNVLNFRALLDTGNQLRDPLNGNPVLLVEKEVAASSIPDELQSYLNMSLEECNDPWPCLWRDNPNLMRRLVFIPFQTIDRQSWLLGIRPERVTCFDKNGSHQIQATVALVRQMLSSEGEYQALLHPELLQKGGDE